ncbi:MAG: endo-1,4-beta-xylanase [Planctomycetota bacterium]|nr:endo-1,4-beta-xylanase [Planctomycetota bacterium]
MIGYFLRNRKYAGGSCRSKQGKRAVMRAVAEGLEGRVLLADLAGSLSILATWAGAPGSSGRDTLGVFVSDGLAYVAEDNGGLAILDVSDPSQPVHRSSILQNREVTDVFVSNGMAYVASGSYGFAIVDVHDPVNPDVRGTPDWFGSEAWEVQVVGNTAYVAHRENGLQIIDVSDPDSPTIVGEYNHEGGLALGVSVVGEIAYVADHAAGLEILNVSDPEHPSLITRYSMPGYAHDVDIRDGLAYVAAAQAGVQVVDVSDPENPKAVGSPFPSQHMARDIKLDSTGQYAYVADWVRGSVQLFDVSTPSALKLIDTCATAGQVNALAIGEDGTVYAASSGNLTIIERRLPVEMPGTGHYYEPVAGVMSWTEARDAAAGGTYKGMLGHLATITSAAENEFVYGLVKDNPDMWYVDGNGTRSGPWLGGYQEPGQDVAPNVGWKWVTGENWVEWDPSPWIDGNPDDWKGDDGVNGEDYLQYLNNATIQGPRWNDAANIAYPKRGYVVEYEPAVKYLGLAYPCFNDTDYANPSANKLLNYVQSTATRVNTIELVPSWHMLSKEGSIIERDKWWSNDPDELQLQGMIADAKRRGWRVVLKPHIDVRLPGDDGELYTNDDKIEWRGEILPNDPNDPDCVKKWFTNYENFITTYARIAKDYLGPEDVFVIGCELKKMSGNYKDLWIEHVIEPVNDLISSRKCRLTYAANWDEYPTVAFWDRNELDFIGIDGYFPVEEPVAGLSPAYQDYLRKWVDEKSKILTLCNQYNKPVIFTEVGCPSQDKAYLAPNDASKHWNVNEQVQLYYCQAAAEAWRNEPRFAGMVFWWLYPETVEESKTHDGFTLIYTRQDGAGAITIEPKKAAMVLGVDVVPLRQVADSLGTGFGAALSDRVLTDSYYAAKFAQNFSVATLENDHKAESIWIGPDQYDFDKADQLVDWAAKNNVQVKYHCLLWAAPQGVPDWLRNGNYTQAQVQEMTKDYIEEVLSHYNNERFKGMVKYIDVVNEWATKRHLVDDENDPLNGYPETNWWVEHFGLDENGHDAMECAFKWAAAQADTLGMDVELLYNDFGMEGSGVADELQFSDPLNTENQAWWEKSSYPVMQPITETVSLQTTYKPANVSFDGGVLNLVVPAGTQEGGQYESKLPDEPKYGQRFGFGSYRAKIRASDVAGTVQGMSLYKRPYSDGPSQFGHREIDIEFGLVEDRHAVLFTTWVDGVKASDSFGMTLAFDPWTEFHEYGFNWLPDDVTFLIDGQLVGSISKKVPQEPCPLMFNNWINDLTRSGDSTMLVKDVTYVPLDRSDEAYHKLLRLKSEGIRVDGVGFQSHLGSGAIPAQTTSHFDRLDGAGFDIYVSEFDTDGTPRQSESEQEQVYRDYLTLCLEYARTHPSFKAFQMWDFWDGATWNQPDDPPQAVHGGLYDSDWQVKHTYNAFYEAFAAQGIFAVSNGVCELDTSHGFSSLSFSGGTVNVPTGSSKPVVTYGLTITGEASLNLNDNELMVRGTAATRNRILEDVSAWIETGRAGGLWSGPGITSETVKGTPFATLAAILNDRGDGTSILTAIDGVPVGPNDVVVKYTWNGDANLDGLVNADDYFLADSGYITQKGDWYNGDFNYDDTINADDYFLIDSAYIGQSGPLAASKPQSAVSADVVAMKQAAKKADSDGIVAQLFSTAPVL